ncbi:MAG: TrkA family potassium uptake protein [Thermaerobacter sp.]|nr:TrkA family potassium uptake protein [Thermaerobacter sp.]
MCHAWYRAVTRRIRWALPLIAATVLGGTIALHGAYHAPWLLSLYLVISIMSTVSDSRIHPVSPTQIIVTGILIIVGTGLWIFVLSLFVSYILEADLDSFKERRTIMEIRRWKNHFVVVGAGRVGESIARELSEMGETVVIVDKDPDRVARVREAGFTTFLLHGFSADAFRPANFPSAKGLALALPDDAENLYAYLTANALNEHLQVVARAQTAEAAQYLHDLGIERVILPDIVGGRRLARMLVKPVAHDLLMALLNEEGVQITEIAVDDHSPIAHQPVQRVRDIFGADVTLIGYWRNQQLHMAPRATDVLLPNDTIILVQSTETAT